MKKSAVLIFTLCLCLLLISSSIAQTGDDYFNRAKAAYARGDWDSAIDEYTRFIQVRPNESSGYSNRGAAYAEKKDYQSSLRDTEKAVQLDSSNATAYLNR